MHTTCIRARYGETDQMGIIYHPNYYIYFEDGRTDYLRALGLSYKEMEAQGIMLPLVETHCRYILPAKYDDLLTIQTTVKEMSVARIIFAYKLFREADVPEKEPVLLAEGQTVQAFTNSSGRPINMKKVSPVLFEKLNAIVDRK